MKSLKENSPELEPLFQEEASISPEKFAAAVDLFAQAFPQEPEAEFPKHQIYTIAVAAPLERRTSRGIEILKGAGQTQ
ncbi:hypothetical protein [Umezakia ovalisporum]|uniref:hypothetical protein n=1 Tax=Umezakia ovalisporum TaxID=75695 RepID=UPI00247613AB|nr:hypothetical protein [Umezakia ovalisporum]MDH6086552.1 hypothetical protein [Umezakia ovalisporum TAC611]